MKKVLSIILCAVVCIAMLPAGAFAAGQVSAPKSLTAKVTEDKTVTVSWSKAAGAKGYKIYRAESRYNENYRYTSYKCIKTVTSKSTVKYTDKTVKPGKKYYYKVKAYNVTGGKKKYSGYTKVKSAYVEPESWTIERLEKDLISYLTEKGYTARAVDMGAKYGEEWYISSPADTSGNYSDDYNRVLKKVKKDVLKEVEELKASYEEDDEALERYSLAIGIDIKDYINPYSNTLVCAEVYVIDDSDVEYDYLLSEEQIAQYRAEILKLINIEREKEGLNAVSLNVALSEMAQVKVKEISDLKYRGHVSPVYGTTTEMAKTFGITDKGCYEILDHGADEPQDAMEDWLNSEGHRNVILNVGKWSKYTFTQIGIGIYSNKQSGYKTWAVEFIE